MSTSRTHEPRRQRTERRAVAVRDPSLSPEANRILTEELRAVVGAAEVDVRAGAPHRERERHGGRAGLLVALVDNRLAVGMTVLGGIVLGGILVLTTGLWWLLALAVGMLALVVLVVVGITLQLTSEVEHLSPSAAARLEDEGVADPDALFTELVEEFSGSRTSAAERRRSRPIGP